MKTKSKLHWTANGKLYLATAGNGVTVAAKSPTTAELLLQKKLYDQRKQLYKIR